jgi:hypothetical protein
MDKGSKIILAGCSLFIAENVLLSHNRDVIIAKTGSEKNYQTLYSCLSLAACSGVAYGYLRHGRFGARWGAFLPVKGPVRIVPIAVQTVGIIGLLQSAPKLQVPFAYQTPKEASTPSELDKEPGVGGMKMLCPIDVYSSVYLILF